MPADVIQGVAIRSIAGDWEPPQHRLNPPAIVQLLEHSPASDEAKSIFRAPQLSSNLVTAPLEHSVSAPVRHRWTQQTHVLTSVTSTTTSFAADDHDATGTEVVFINVQNPSKALSGATQSKVKAHAMRHVHQRKRNPDQDPFQLQGVIKTARCSHSVTQTSVTQATYRVNRFRLGSSVKKLSSRISNSQEPLHSEKHGSRLEHDDVSMVCHHCGEFSLLPQAIPEQAIPTNSRVPRGPSRESFNAFGSSASPLTHRVHELMHFYVTVLSPKINPYFYGKGNRDVVSLALSDMLRSSIENPACMHALAAEGAWCAQRLRVQNGAQALGQGLGNGEISYHVFEAVKLIQEQFQDPRQALSNSTLFTASSLAGVATKSSDEQFAAHQDGLVRMIELRGGINAIPRWLASKVTKGDALMSWLRQKEPLIPMYRSRFYGDKRSIEKDTLLRQLGTPLANDTLKIFLSPGLYLAAQDLHRLTQLTELHIKSSYRLSPVALEFAEDTYAKCQHEVVSLPAPLRQPDASTEQYRQHAWSVAALVYLNSAIRDCLSPNLLHTMVDRLIQSLQRSDLVSLWQPNSEVLLWVFFMGFYAASGRPEQVWFAIELRRLVQYSRYQSMQCIKKVLERMFYRPLIYDEHLVYLCSEHLKLPIALQHKFRQM